MGFDDGEWTRIGEGKGGRGSTWREVEASWKAFRRSLPAVKIAPELVKTAKRMKEPWRSRIRKSSDGQAVGKVVSSIGSGMLKAGMG